MFLLIRLKVLVLASVGLVGCDGVGLGSDCEPFDAPRALPTGDWGDVAKMLDDTSFHNAPYIERGAHVYGKVVVGDVEIVSSDPSVVAVLDIDERHVGRVCDNVLWCCRPDFDTWFTLEARSQGEAELIVNGSAGDQRRLGVRVADSASVDIVEFGEREPLSEALIAELGPEGFGFEARVLDASGEPMVTHSTWTLDHPENIEFAPVVPGFFTFPIGTSETSDVFADSTPNRHVGPVPFLWPVAEGATTLRVETGGGLSARIAVRSELARGRYPED